MSKELLLKAIKFLGDKDSDYFVSTFMDQWKKERDSGLLLMDDRALSEAMSTIFCLSDLFNPDSDRLDYELSTEGLHQEVSRVLKEARLI